METEKTCNVLSIDAWRDTEGGWVWNAWYKVGAVPLAVCEYKPRRLLAYMRTAGFLSAASAGRVAIDDDGFNVVIMERATRRPVYAIEYGPHC